MGRTLERTRDPNCAKFLAIFDPHLTGISPPSYKVDYWAMMQALFKRLWAFADDQRVDAILCAGDLFHRKAPHQNSIAFLNEVIDLLKNAPAPVLGIAGNHDVKWGSWKTGLKGQPLENMIKAGVYHLLDDDPWTFCIGDPGGEYTSVRVDGGSYHQAQAAHVRDLKKGPYTKYLIALGHFWFGPQSGEFYGEPVYGPDYLGLSEVDLFLIGHHHEDQGIQTIGGKIYDSHGALTRTGAHQHDITRAPAASLITVTAEGIEAQVVRPKFPTPEESLDLEKLSQIKEENAELDRFAQALNLTEATTLDPRDILDKSEMSAEVRERARHYLNLAEAER